MHPIAFRFNSIDLGAGAYEIAFGALNNFNIPIEVLKKIIRVFDENITSLEKAYWIRSLEGRFGNN